MKTLLLILLVLAPNIKPKVQEPEVKVHTFFVNEERCYCFITEIDGDDVYCGEFICPFGVKVNLCYSKKQVQHWIKKEKEREDGVPKCSSGCPNPEFPNLGD